ncbi:MAG: methylated-DNA--[protein]-cysteine S-methyltransferase [Candidatus Eremiobacteraeota bacterium]|nr:methylated-DNA--[protein]-cysteine S-methyltransferase [Candidatus Eremiobacteraeota bacterium]
MDTDYERVAKAIDFLIEHRHEQPSLDDVARDAGLSPFHFQRLFRRYAGVTPKQFLAALTLESAKVLLDRNASVLDAALDVGLSSPARLHDHFVSIDAMSPGEYKSGGASLDVIYGFAQTPFGLMFAGTTPRGVAMLEFVEPGYTFDPARTPLPNATFTRDDAVAESIAARAFGDDEQPLHLHVRGTNFQLRVWSALLNVRSGAVKTYADLARDIGEPNAARAVGNALGANPVAVLIPCHRVIASTGIVGNYKWGTEKKRALLAWESARGSQNATTR